MGWRCRVGRSGRGPWKAVTEVMFGCVCVFPFQFGRGWGWGHVGRCGVRYDGMGCVDGNGGYMNVTGDKVWYDMNVRYSRVQYCC